MFENVDTNFEHENWWAVIDTHFWYVSFVQLIQRSNRVLQHRFDGFQVFFSLLNESHTIRERFSIIHVILGLQILKRSKYQRKLIEKGDFCLGNKTSMACRYAMF